MGDGDMTDEISKLQVRVRELENAIAQERLMVSELCKENDRLRAVALRMEK